MDFGRELRFALRSVTRHPSLAVVATLTLAVGIGATSAVFSVVDAVLLRPLAYAEPARLVALFADEARRQGRRNPTSPADFLEWRKASRTLDRLTAAHPWSPVLTGRGPAEELTALKATPELFDLLGVPAERGRAFKGPLDERQVVLSHALWKRRFGGDPAIVGQSLVLDGESYAVAAVMPPDFRFPPFWATGAEMWVPLVLAGPQEASHDQFLRVFGRLRFGATLEDAQAEMDVVGARLASAWPASNAAVGVNVEALQEPVVSQVRPALFALAGGVVLVLLIACVNVANLLLAQGLSREKEAAVRAALGASRGRLVRQWLAEALVLALAGSAAGLGLAYLGIGLLHRWGPPRGLPRTAEIALDGRLVVFALALALLTALVSGIVPALRASAGDLANALKPGERGASGRGRHRLHDLLIVAQLAMAVVLLIGAGLLLKSFLLLSRPDTGFRSEGLLTLGLSLAGSPQAAAERRPAFMSAVLERVRAVPGVANAAFVNHLPIAGDTWRVAFRVEGVAVPDEADPPRAVIRTATADYMHAMEIPILRGRAFDERDGASGEPVVLVNEALARRHWPAADPIGARVKLGRVGEPGPWRTVVGVVADARQSGLTEPVTSELLFPYAQDPVGWYEATTLVVRSAGEPRDLAEPVRAQLVALAPELPVSRVRTMPEILAESIGQERFNATLFGLFSAIALLLAAVGVYGVMAYAIGRRTHEIGIRMALGARAAGVTAMVIGEALRLAACGAGLGLLGALALSRALASLLHGVSPTDPATFAEMIVLLLAVAALAAFLPARRAARVDPLVALREG